jgi:hypothetical protein
MALPRSEEMKWVEHSRSREAAESADEVDVVVSDGRGDEYDYDEKCEKDGEEVEADCDARPNDDAAEERRRIHSRVSDEEEECPLTQMNKCGT